MKTNNLNKLIQESIEKTLKEYTNPYGEFDDYQGEDMTFDSVFDHAEHKLIEDLKMGKHYSTVHELMEELYDIKTFNESDFETVYDACEAAMMEVYYDDELKENTKKPMTETTKLNISDINYIVAEAVKRIIAEDYKRNSQYWAKSGYEPRDGMTGGAWGVRPVLGVYHVDVYDLIETVDEETYSDDLYDKLMTLEDKLYFNVEAEYGFDDSVGIPEGYSNIKVDYSPCVNAVSNLSLFRGDEIQELKNAIEKIAYKVENDGEGVNWDDDWKYR